MNRQFIEIEISSTTKKLIPVDAIESISIIGNKLHVTLSTGGSEIVTCEYATLQYLKLKERLAGLDADERTYIDRIHPLHRMRDI